VPGIKDDQDHWEFRGHKLRILTISESELKLFAQLFEDPGTPALQARLPQVHSRPLLTVLEKFAAAPRRLGDLQGEYLATEMFHESNAQRDGIITRQDDPAYQPETADQWVVSGPHFFVGTPLNKTPRRKCTEKAHYDDIDLTRIPDDFLPRAVYRPGNRDGDLDAFHAAIPEWPKPGLRLPILPAGKEAEGQGLSLSSPPGRGAGGEGFWPIADHEVPAWEALLGESLRRYGLDPEAPGAGTARRFGHFDQWQGPVQEAVTWLLAHQNQRDATTFASRFAALQLRQREPGEEAMRWLPRPLTTRFRYLNRVRCQAANERTLIPTIVPAGASHLDGGISIAFTDVKNLVSFAGAASSINYDFLLKTSGKNHARQDVLSALPFLATKAMQAVLARNLRLSCLTTHYAPLWQTSYTPAFNTDAWTSTDPRLTHRYELRWDQLTPDWQRGCALRSDYARRQALLEIDVLVALSLDLSLDELIQIYTVQFPVMKAYEQVDRYDAHGRRLPNTARKDPGAKELREALETHDGNDPVTISWSIDNGEQTVTRSFHPPFTPVDRIDDYGNAYHEFQRRLSADQAQT
jgi:hypothetical protein